MPTATSKADPITRSFAACKYPITHAPVYPRLAGKTAECFRRAPRPVPALTEDAGEINGPRTRIMQRFLKEMWTIGHYERTGVK